MVDCVPERLALSESIGVAGVSGLPTRPSPAASPFIAQQGYFEALGMISLCLPLDSFGFPLNRGVDWRIFQC